MREDDLRTVLLVKGIEDTDREAAVIPSADRAAAAREALRAAPPGARHAGDTAAMLDPGAQALLVARARLLLPGIAARHPFVQEIVALLGPSAALLSGLLILGFALGVGLSALDGARRINVLAFPLLGLVAWNFAVYALLVIFAFRPAHTRPAPVRAWIASLGQSMAARLIARSRAFSAAAADALDAFAREWYESAKPLLLARVTRAFHLAAAAVGAGLVAGLYVRGIAFEYEAGWESTFLDAPRARAILSIVYGPASWLTGIPVPDVARLEATRWRQGTGGEPAAQWIHLMAASAFIYVVVPRLLLALAAAATVMRLALRARLPASLPAYFRAAFGGVDGAVARATAVIMPYACELSPGALAQLITWLRGSIGGDVGVEARASLPYGEEASYLASLGERGGDVADVIVLPFSLASTPEDENHGTVIAGVRDWIVTSRPRAQLRVVIDEAPFAQRMAGSPQRVAERREAWRHFVEARGLKAEFTRFAP